VGLYWLFLKQRNDTALRGIGAVAVCGCVWVFGDRAVLGMVLFFVLLSAIIFVHFEFGRRWLRSRASTP